MDCVSVIENRWTGVKNFLPAHTIESNNGDFGFDEEERKQKKEKKKRKINGTMSSYESYSR